MNKLSLLLLLFTHSLWAQNQETSPIIVTSKQSLEASELLSDSYIISRDDLDLMGVTTVGQALSNVAGIELSQTGALAGESSIFIRGMGSAYTLILINGIKVFDPTTTNRGFNLSILNTLNIERVEVLKGNQAVLYGSDAIGGVINIITQKGQNPKSFVKTGLGNYELLSANQSVNFSSSILNLGGYFQKASGENDVEDGSEKDEKNLQGVDFSYIWSQGKWNSETFYKRSTAFFNVDHYNSSTNETEDDDHLYNETHHELIHQRLQYDFTQLNSLTIDLSQQKFKRWNKTLYNSDYSTYGYEGDVSSFEMRYNESWNKNQFVVGVNASTERYADDTTPDEYLGVIEAFYNQHYFYEGYDFEFGARGISNENFGQHLITSLGAKKYFFKNMYTRASFKTGFKAPSLYQQKAPSYGNEDLTPEKSESLELSLGREDKKFSYGTTLFYTEIGNQINYTTKYVNDDFAITRGIELFSKYKWQYMSLDSSLVLLNLEPSGDKEQARRPDYSMTQSLNWQIFKADLLSIKWRSVGRRFDNKGSSEQVELDAYNLVDLSYSHKFEVGKVNFQLNNIFDEDYELARGYRTLGTNLQVDLVYNY